MPIFDSHAYVAETAFGRIMADKASVLSTMKRHQIDQIAVISGVAASCDFAAGNNQLRDIVDSAAGIFGYCTLNAGYPAESLEEQRRHLTRRDFVAAVMFGHDGIPVTLADAHEVINAQRRYAKPLAIHTPDAEAVHAVRVIAAEFPAMKLLMLTMGGDDWHAAVSAAKAHVNLYLEISGTLDSDKIAYASSVLSARKLVYGSGLPYRDPQSTIGLVEEAATLTNFDRARIYYQNAQGLFIAERESSD